MSKGWIKYHRQILDNKLIQDHNCYIIFTGLLLLVDKDSGEYDTGRFTLSDRFKMNPSTVYKALKRLEKKWKMVTLTSNNKYTTVKVVKWHDYQATGNTNGNNKVTTREQQGNTKQELKNRELRKKEILGVFFEDKIWKNYPSRDGRKGVKKQSKAWIVNNLKEDQMKDFLTALNKYRRYLTKSDFQRPMDCQRWVKQWESWLDLDIPAEGELSKEVLAILEGMDKKNEQQ